MGTRCTARTLAMGIFIPSLALVAGSDASPVAGQELPPAIEVDRLLLLAEQQMQDQDLPAASASLDRILELQTQHDLELQESSWFRHARVALDALRPQVARASAIRYLQITGQAGDHYIEALELINEADELMAMPAERIAELEAWFRDPGSPLEQRVGMNSGLFSGSLVWDSHYYEKYRIAVRAGQLIVVTMTSNDLDPYLELAGADRTILAADDDSGPGNGALLRYTASSSGDYFIIVRSWSSRDTGLYEVRWEAQPPMREEMQR